jgi:hypothetical protein
VETPSLSAIRTRSTKDFARIFRMDLHCHLAQVEFMRDLFVLATGDNERKDVPFACR